MPSREWLETEVTISRAELGDIIAREIAEVVKAAEVVNDDPLTDMIKNLLVEFSASVASEIFKKAEEE